MLIVTESKAQGWRALVMMNDNSEMLLFVGRSSTQVRGGYGEAFQEILDDEERSRVSTIKLQQWQGAPDAGKWMDKAELRKPVTTKTAARIVA